MQNKASILNTHVPLSKVIQSKLLNCVFALSLTMEPTFSLTSNGYRKSYLLTLSYDNNEGSKGMLQNIDLRLFLRF